MSLARGMRHAWLLVFALAAAAAAGKPAACGADAGSGSCPSGCVARGVLMHASASFSPQATQAACGFATLGGDLWAARRGCAAR